MAAQAPTNNCIADIASINATFISDILMLPFAGESDSSSYCSSPTIAAIDRLQHAISSRIDLSFQIPEHPGLSFFGGHYSLKSNAVSGRYTVDLPEIRMHIGLLLGVIISAFIGVVFATIIYRTMILNNNNNNGSRQRATSPLLKTMVGMVLFLSCIFVPYALVDISGVQSQSIRFTLSICFVLYMFRVLEALFDFVPTGAKSSWGVYCAYFSLPFDMIFDNEKNPSKPVMATKRDILNGQINVAKSAACIVLLCSILSPLDYMPFGQTNAGEFNERIVLRDYLDVRHLGNCFAIALLFQQALALGDAVIGSTIQITLGYKARQSMRNPMLEATSPSDFWGRRWNVLVHAVMKRGVYKPVRRYSSSAVVASLAVFVASGLFHEWLVHVVFMYSRSATSVSSSSEVLLGSNTAFFVWNFFVIVSERVLAGTKGIHQSFGKMIPNMFIPFLIIMTSLPMAHWFGNPYLKGDYFADYEKCLFLIRKE